jgi:hypothetical protein
MRGGDLIREARLRAGITQATLARRLRTTQPAVARWESGRSRPALETVQEAVRACGFDLQVRMPPFDGHDLALALRRLRLRPARRMEETLEAIAFAEDLRAAGRRRARRVRR